MTVTAELLSWARDCAASAGCTAESAEYLERVSAWRDAWRPPAVRVLLVAESHVAEQPSDTNVRVRVSVPEARPLPSGYCRLVYCLGYGESRICSPQPVSNRGLPSTGASSVSSPGDPSTDCQVERAVLSPSDFSGSSRPWRLYATEVSGWLMQRSSLSTRRVAGAHSPVIGMPRSSGRASSGSFGHQWRRSQSSSSASSATASRDLLKKCLSSRRRWSSASRRTATPLGIEAGSRASALFSSSSDRAAGLASPRF